MSNSVKENSTVVLKEKSIEGELDYVLELIQVEQVKDERKKANENNLRLCLSVRGQKTSTVFGGAVAFDIRPNEHEYYFERIKTFEEFVQFSERIRQRIIDTLKG